MPADSFICICWCLEVSMWEISASKPDTRWWRRMESEYKSQKDLYFLLTLLTDFIGTTFYQKKVVPLKSILWIVTRIMNTFFGNSCCCWFSLNSPPLYWTGGINTWTNKNQDYLNGFISLNEIWVKHHWNSWTLNSFWLKIHLPPFSLVNLINISLLASHLVT